MNLLIKLFKANNLVKITPTLLRNQDKFILFFNKVLSQKNPEFKNNHKFL